MKKGLVNSEMAEKMAGVQKPHSFPVLDAGALEFKEAHQVIREDIKQNKIIFEFPSGFNKLSLYEECRALTKLDDFDAMYDVTMQMLTNQDLRILMRVDGDDPVELCLVHITNKFEDLRANCPIIDEYPCLVQWLTEFIAADLLKKYPLPGKATPRPATAKDLKGKAKGE